MQRTSPEQSFSPPSSPKYNTLIDQPQEDKTEIFEIKQYDTLIKSEKKTEQKSPEELQVIIDGQNLAMLPSATLCGMTIFQINRKILGPNLQRAEWLMEHFKESKSSADILCFQEAFAGKTRQYLIDQLKKDYPYHTNKLGEKFLNAGSGLMIFSKYPIIDQYFEKFTDTKGFVERFLANKGFMAVKIQIDKKHFITVYNTHLQAGASASLRYETTSEIRGKQMQQMHNHFVKWHNIPIKNQAALIHAASLFDGDVNFSVDDPRKTESKSIGMSNNGFSRGDVKYAGIYNWFQSFLYTRPTNWINTRFDEPFIKGKGKTYNKKLVSLAKEKNAPTGSTLHPDRLKEYRQNPSIKLTSQDTEGKIIDALMCSKEGLKGEFTTTIIPFSQDKIISDHFRLRGIWKYNGSKESDSDTIIYPSLKL